MGVWQHALFLITVVACVFGSRQSSAGSIVFGRDIRPILSDKCFACHGADEGTRQADLRLDLREEAIGSGSDSASIVPGHPEKSLVLERILSSDPDLRMPPADSNKSLTPEQIQLIKQWIQEGAPYSPHWAFVPVTPVPVPKASEESWCRNEIDAFILDRLNQVKLAPSREASRPVLIRRLYQDLLGLLPSPEETEAFQNDPSVNAYEELVDRVLQNPHYGERWGRHWLDQARYADSHGFTIDGARTMWPYRDWVIQALNSDLPFDEFTRQQLAGDLLPDPTKSQLVATAFHRNTMINQEGGVKPDQYRHEAIIDRVNTTGTVWLGLTIGCAQCHTHKFDPISHEEYYRLYAFFNACRDANDTGATAEVFQDEMFGLSDSQRRILDELPKLRRQLRELEATTKSQQNEQLRLAQWDWIPATVFDYSTAANGTFQQLPDGSLLSDQNGDDNDTYRVSVRLPKGTVAAIRLRVLPHPSLPHRGPGLAQNGNFVLTNVELRANNKKLLVESAWADHEQEAYPASAVIDQDSQTGWAINVSKQQREKNPQVVMNAPHELVLQLAKPLKATSESEITITLSHEANMRYLIGCFAIDYSTIAPEIPGKKREPELAELREEIQSLERLVSGRGLPENLMIMNDLDQPPETYRLKRGDFLQPATDEGKLSPGIPASLLDPQTTDQSFTNRLNLAHWLVSHENPLTARVTVNRIWMRYFGHGLVETENDFGFQGSPPTHPELLDWLAGEFINQGWSMKKIHRLIVTSATYRQSSEERDDLEFVDPRNLLLARQSRLRVEAEIVRDLALSVSGRLSPKIGGPSVFPPQPEGVYSFTQNKKNWTESQGPDRYRRTMYTMFYRSAPYPLLTTFDSPDFSSACTQRSRSNTPLQSLTLANDKVFIELAQGLADRVLRETSDSPEFPDRLERLYQLCFSRGAESSERNLLESFWNEELSRYQQNQEATRQMTSTLQVPDEARPELAAWTSLARVLINTDEFVTRN